MILFPAIDLKGGRVVRLVHGDMARETVFNDDPADQARRFAAMGFAWLHVVDLDGAVEGAARNAASVAAILAATPLRVQLGGGIRDLAAVQRWLDAGVRRVILGTAAVRDPALVRDACRRFPGRVALGIDARDGRVAVEGWAQATELSALEVARRFEDAGAAAIVYTDIGRDGALAGVNVGATAALAAALSTPVIASGGVSGLADIEALLTVAHTGIEGVISGRALYDGRLDPAAALALLEGRRTAC
jgi:phosphoribosylformimino-5-aminoimidazole carboxamide ribotide isomerase